MMRSVSVGEQLPSVAPLGFGCSAVLGRVGRRDSLAALNAAFDVGITFYDTARAYGYGESEALLGSFLKGKRTSVVISTKFGILPAKTSLLKETVKPLARKILQLLPSAKKAVQKQIGAQFISNQFTVAVLQQSVETSLRKLQTDYIDMLFLHSAPASVLQQDDLMAAMQQMVREGKVRRAGISSSPAVIQTALAADIAGLQSFQFPCNMLNVGIVETLAQHAGEFVAVANHPFGGTKGVAESKAILTALGQSSTTPNELKDKLQLVDDSVLADVVLNAITQGTRIQVVVPSMMRLKHLQTNLAAMERSRFSAEELGWLRTAIAAAAAAKAPS